MDQHDEALDRYSCPNGKVLKLAVKRVLNHGHLADVLPGPPYRKDQELRLGICVKLKAGETQESQ